MSRALLLACFIWLEAVSARAFSDPEMFAASPLEGGGGGRYFTGSPTDGQTCAACHRGGPEPVMTLSGLPERFEPGRRYEVAVRWQDMQAPHALQLELLSERGESPELALPDPLPAADRCDSLPDGDPATYVKVSGARRIVGVRDCRASELRFSFVAPAARRLIFAATAVRSDSQGDSEGDGVSELRAVIYDSARGRPSSGCAAAGRTDGGWLLCLLWLLWLRRRTLLLCFLGACYQPDFSADYIEPVSDAAVVAIDAALDAQPQPDLDARVADAAPKDAGWSAQRVTVRVQTDSFGGRYAPRNIGAIWIEDAQGGFVKALERWAGTRAMYLRTFNAVSGGDLTDAITGATLPTHQLHERSWDITNRAGARVPKGDYALALELTDRDGSGAVRRVPFRLGDGPFVTTPEDSPQFKQLQLRLE